MSEKAEMNEGEIQASKEQLFDVVRRGLCLPPSYRVWSVCDMGDHMAVLVESDKLPASDSNEPIPLLAPEIQILADGSARLLRIRCTHRGCTANLLER